MSAEEKPQEDDLETDKQEEEQVDELLAAFVFCSSLVYAGLTNDKALLKYL